MSLKPGHHSGVKDLQDGDYAEDVTREASGVEGGRCQHEDELRGGSHHDVQEDVGRDRCLVKVDDPNWGSFPGRGLGSTDVSHKYEDASILKGATSSKKEKSPAPIELEPMNMVSTRDLLTSVSMDGSASRFLQHAQQAVNDETVEDEHLEQAVKDKLVEDEYLEQDAKDERVEDRYLEQTVEDVREELPPDRKDISAKALLQQHVIMDSQDSSVLLPEELVLVLFKFIKPGDVLSASQTCLLWRKLGENDKLWEQKCKEVGLTFSLTAANLRALERRNKNSTIAYSAWKENFLKPYKIAKKFRQEFPQVFTVKMRDQVNQLRSFQFYNDKIVSTCGDNLYVFCALSGKLLHKLVGQTSAMLIVIDKQFIVSGSFDESLKVWNVDTGSRIHTLYGHTGRVLCLQMHGAIAVSGSSDGTLRMWDVREGTCFQTITGDIKGYVNLLQFDGRIVVSGSTLWSGDINVWDPETGVCLRTLNQQNINYFKLNGGHVLVMHRNGSIKVWEVDTGVCRHTLEGNDPGYMELHGDMLVSRSGTNAKIWSLSTGACLHTLDGPQKHSRDINGLREQNGPQKHSRDINGVRTLDGSRRHLREIHGLRKLDSLQKHSPDINGLLRKLDCPQKHSRDINGLRTLDGTQKHSRDINGLRTLDGTQKHSRDINGIGINDRFVVTSSIDRKLKLWDIKTGDFIRDLFELESGGVVVEMKIKQAKIVCLIQVHILGRKLLVLNFDTNDAD